MFVDGHTTATDEMCTRVAARQLLRWTVRSPPSSVFSPLQVQRCHIRTLYIEGRLLCSSTNQSPLQSIQLEHGNTPESGKTELSLRSLTDMGFTHIQAEQIYEAVSSIRGASAAKHALSTLTALFVLGLNPSSVLKVLEKCPELYTVKDTLLQQRISNLRKLGLVEGSLQRVVTYNPKILTVPVKTIKNVVAFLRERCLFTVQQVTDILRFSPAVVLEDQDQLEYKFQYVYFRMGVKQAEMVKCRLFRFTMDEVRCRHTFLERRGLYQTPDKRGQTTIINPKLDSVLNFDQDAYLKDVAQATAEEYDVFQRLMARECQEEELQQGRIEADDDHSEYDGDDDNEYDDDETAGKSGVTLMVVDTYAAVRWPLHYRHILPPARTHRILAGVWVLAAIYPFALVVVVDVQSENPQERLAVCLVLISLGFIQVQNMVGIHIYFFVAALICATLIFYCYIRLYMVTRTQGIWQSRFSRARVTLLAHGFLLLLYFAPGFVFTMELFMFQRTDISKDVRVWISTVNMCIFMLLPRAFAPYLYGLRYREISDTLMLLLHRHRRLTQTPVS